MTRFYGGFLDGRLDTKPLAIFTTCGGFKMSFEDECRDCFRQRQVVTERRRQAARDRKIGPLWPRER